MEREDNSEPIPIDIILEILLRSSTKSIARFGLSSKSCASILSRPDFTKLFSARSKTQPRLLFVIKYSGKWRLYSAPQPHQNPDEKRSLVVAADFHMQFHGDMIPENICGSLLYFSNEKPSKDDTDSASLICNPSTGQYARLPQHMITRKKDWIRTIRLLGYDPIGKQYKVLALSNNGETHILTLGSGTWRKMECNVNHFHIINDGIWINGVLYCITVLSKGLDRVVACFDVRYEKVRFLKTDYSSRKLINYKGKVGVISWCWCSRGPLLQLELSLWILEDDQKQEWLKREYTLPSDIAYQDGFVSFFGVTSTGEFILTMNCYSSESFIVFYFNPERNTLKKVEIQGFEAFDKHARVYGFVDYAEDLKFI